MAKEHEYEVVDNTGASKKVLGRAWWNGSEIETDSPSFMQRLKTINISLGSTKSVSWEDGIDFLKALPKHYKSGYLMAHKVK